MASQAYLDLLEQAKDIHIAKNAGYAGQDNPDPWANFRMSEQFGVTALDGCLVRLSDKYIRITNLRRNPDNEQVGESIRDTLLDLSAYALIAICLLDEQMASEPVRSYDERIEDEVWQEPSTLTIGDIMRTLIDRDRLAVQEMYADDGPRCDHHVPLVHRCDLCILQRDGAKWGY